MAVFKQELNWSTYQDKQLKVLESLEQSFSSSLKTSKLIEDNLTIMSRSIDSMVRTNKLLADSVEALYTRMTTNEREFSKSTREASNNMRGFSEGLSSGKVILDQYGNVIEDVGKKEQEREYNRQVEEERRRREDREHEQEDNTRRRERGKREGEANVRLEIFTKSLENVANVLNYIGKEANQYSAISNSMIKISGLRGDEIRDFRSEVVGIVQDLNKETGNFFNPQESYRQIVAVSQGITGNTKAIEEMTRPLLLTQETLDVNLSNMADLFNRFYVRYNFTSAEMEEMVDSIRNNTAGNSANAEAALRSLEVVENDLVLAAKGDKDMMQQLLEANTRGISYINSLGLDSTYYTDIVDKILTDEAKTDPAILSLLNETGHSLQEVQNMILGGQGDKVYEILAQSAAAIGSRFYGYSASKQSADAYGLDYDTMIDAAAAMVQGDQKTLEEFLATEVQNNKATDLVEDKFISQQDQLINKVDGIYKILADIQEVTGIAWTDAGALLAGIASILGVIAGNRFLGGMLGKSGGIFASSTGGAGTLFSRAGGAAVNAARTGASTIGSATAGKAGLGGLSAAMGGGLGSAALMTGGVLGGAALGVDGVVGMFDKDASTSSRIFSGLEAAGGAGGAAALIGLGLSNPVGWVALGIGAIGLFAKKATDAADTIGSTEYIENAYKEAESSIQSQIDDQIDSLEQIYANIRTGGDLTEAANDLIQTGMLSSEDQQLAMQYATDGNVSALESLTSKYIEAADTWNTVSQQILNTYKGKDAAYASELHEGLDALFKDWTNKWTNGEFNEDELASMDAFMENLYYGLSSADPESLDKNSQRMLKQLEEIYANGGSLSDPTQAWNLIRTGLFDTAFLNSNIDPALLLQSAQMMAITDSGLSAYNSILPEGSYYGASNIATYANIIGQLSATNDKSQAEALLNQLRDAGYRSQDGYPEIAAQAARFGLTGYARGTNYVDRDQIAVIHEGEAIVPKRYNPAANMNELERLRKQVAEEKSKSSEGDKVAQQYLKETKETLKEIKKIVSDWKSKDTRSSLTNSKYRLQMFASSTSKG